MNRLIICYKYKDSTKIYFDVLKDFNEICFHYGEKIEKLEEQFCRSKKMEIQFEKEMKLKYENN